VHVAILARRQNERKTHPRPKNGSMNVPAISKLFYASLGLGWFTMRYDTIVEFNVDSKAVCDHLNLAFYDRSCYYDNLTIATEQMLQLSSCYVQYHKFRRLLCMNYVWQP